MIFCPQNCHSNSLSRYELPERYFPRRLVVTAVSQFVRGGRCLSPYYILSQIYDYDGGGEDDRSLWFLRWDDDDDQDVSYFVRIERRRCPLLLTFSVRFISRSLCFLRCTLLEIVWSHQLHSKSWKEGHYYKTFISPWERGAHRPTSFLLHSMPDLLLRPNHCNLW